MAQREAPSAYVAIVNGRSGMVEVATASSARGIGWWLGDQRRGRIATGRDCGGASEGRWHRASGPGEGGRWRGEMLGASGIAAADVEIRRRKSAVKMRLKASWAHRQK